MSNILAIDDGDSVCRLLLQVLSKYGYNVETAADGEEGIEKFEQGFADLVITDVLMPGIDGHDVARHIRNSSRKTTPIIGISGTPWFLENDYFDVVLSKPFSIKTLIDAVKSLTAAP